MMKKVMFFLTWMMLLMILSNIAYAKVPEISGYSLDGHYQEKVLNSNSPVFVYFMSPYCSACLELSDNLKQIFAQYPKKEINLIIVARGNKDKIEKIQQKLVEVCNKVIIIHDQNQDVIKVYGIEDIPHLMFIDKSLNLVWEVKPISKTEKNPFELDTLTIEISNILKK